MSQTHYERIAPRLYHRFTRTTTPKKFHDDSARSTLTKKNIEVWITTCIVTNFAGSTTQTATPKLLQEHTQLVDDTECGWYRVLINPCNPGLTGPRHFSYFPRGADPVVVASHSDGNDITSRSSSKTGSPSSTWGGMDVVGSDMLFPAQTVDGMVHLVGGAALRQELDHVLGGCPVGHAVLTTTAPGEQFSDYYHAIVHTSTPNNVSRPPQQRPAGDSDMTYTNNPNNNEFDPEDEAQLLLTQCYSSALQQGLGSAATIGMHPRNILLATPLLGAGCRGFPIPLACTVAARAAMSWFHDPSTVPVTETTLPHSRNISLAFGLLEEATAEQLVRELQNADMKT